MRSVLYLFLLTSCGFLTEDDLQSRMDQDGDGYLSEQFGGKDCDDDNRDIWPGAVEVCDGIDNNCDGDADGDALDKRTWYRDADADGYGSPSTEDPAVTCFPPEGFVGDASDCNDDPNNNGENIHPRTIWYKDKDSDSFGDPEDAVVTCFQLPGLVGDDQDCDDDDADLHPETVWWQDEDGDGFGAIKEETLACWVQEDVPEGFVRAGSTTPDCDDGNTDVYPGVAAYEADPNLCTIDNDSDGYGDETPEDPNHAAGTDCEDRDPAVYPGAQELWHDQRLNDCEGLLNTVSIDVADESLSGGAAGDQLGKAVRGIGYFYSCDPSVSGCTDEGQLPDIAIAAPSEASHGPSSGAVYLIDNEAGTTEFRSTLHGSAAINRLGRHLTATGDLNNDGYHDLAVGTQDDYAYVIFGGSTRDAEITLSTSHKSTNLTVYRPLEEGEELGASAAGLEGFCRDTETALAIGAPRYSSIGDGAGRVYIIVDADQTGTVDFYEIWLGLSPDSPDGTDTTDDDGSGTDTEDAGLDTGIDDFAVASPEIWTVEPEPDGAGALLGDTLATIGDFNGDGIAELAIGAPSADWSEMDAGAVYLLTSDDFPPDTSGEETPGETDATGFTQEISADSLIRLDGKFEGDHLGRALSSAGDFNHDGRDDVAMAATGSSSIPRPGRVYVWFGEPKTSRDPSDPRVFSVEETADLIIEPDDTVGEGNLGGALALAGDLDEDGKSDLLIGSPDADTPAYASGRVYLIYGGAEGTWAIEDLVELKDEESSTSGDPGPEGSSRNGALFTGEAAFYLGSAIDGVGDVTGDGVADLVLGAPGADLYGIGTGAGAVFLLNGVAD